MTESFSTADQASGLRRLFEKRAAPIVAIAATRNGGAHQGERAKVMMQFVSDLLLVGRNLTVLDEHSGMGSLAHAYGVSSHRDLKQALHGDYRLEEVMFRLMPGLSLIPAPRAAGMAFSEGDEASLVGNLALLRSRSDFIMIDSSQRKDRALSPIAVQADRLIVMVPAGNDDLTHAYGLIKRAVKEKMGLHVSVVVVRAADAQQARGVYDKLKNVAFDHLGIILHYQGAALTPGAKSPSLMKVPMSLTPVGRSGLDGPGAMSGCWDMADSMV